jgi:multicomponent Na+:H+ antiporter subunit B
MSLDLILRVGTKLILPFIMLFALYVQFHGDYGPGGGFQAGVISAGAVILLAITFGLGRAKRIAPPAIVDRMVPLGVLIFAGAGVVGLLRGRNYLDYAVFHHDPVLGHEWGILIVEAGVLVTVAGTMIALFYAFVERGR